MQYRVLTVLNHSANDRGSSLITCFVHCRSRHNCGTKSWKTGQKSKKKSSGNTWNILNFARLWFKETFQALRTHWEKLNDSLMAILWLGESRGKGQVGHLLCFQWSPSWTFYCWACRVTWAGPDNRLHTPGLSLCTAVSYSWLTTLLSQQINDAEGLVHWWTLV